MSTPVPDDHADLSQSSEQNGNEVERCTNCEAEMHGIYCSACGQRNEPLRKPIGHFLRQSFVEIIGVDGRLWKSLSLLFFKPGQLTNSYLAGHHVRFVRPLRMYLLSSLLFFSLLALMDPLQDVEIGDEYDTDAVTTAGAYREKINNDLAQSRKELAAIETLVDSLEIRVQRDSLVVQMDSTKSFPENHSDLVEELEEEAEERGYLREEVHDLRWIAKQLETAPPDSVVRPALLMQVAEMLRTEVDSNIWDTDLPAWWPKTGGAQQIATARTRDEMNTALRSFLEGALQHFPTVIFLLLPIYALLLKLIYIRRDWYYTEHLVFGLHTHAFAFFVFTMILLLSSIGGTLNGIGIVNIALLLLLPIYSFAALYVVYQQGWIRTLLKMFLLGVMYFFVLIVGVVLALVFAAIL